MESWNKYLLSAYYVSVGSALFECLLYAIQKTRKHWQRTTNVPAVTLSEKLIHIHNGCHPNQLAELHFNRCLQCLDLKEWQGLEIERENLSTASLTLIQWRCLLTPLTITAAVANFTLRKIRIIPSIGRIFLFILEFDFLKQGAPLFP